MIWAIGYGLGAIVTTGLAYRRLLWNERDTYWVDAEDYALFLVGAVMIGAVWPLFALAVPVVAWAKRDLEKNHPQEVANRQRRRETEIREREREIERIETELGIHEPDRNPGFPGSRGLFSARGMRR